MVEQKYKIVEQKYEQIMKFYTTRRYTASVGSIFEYSVRGLNTKICDR